MVCPKCGSDNVNAQMIEVSARTSHRRRGCLWSLCRIMLIICTCGLWLLVGRSKGTSKTKVKNASVWVCQNCGYNWRA